MSDSGLPVSVRGCACTSSAGHTLFRTEQSSADGDAFLRRLRLSVLRSGAGCGVELWGARGEARR